MSSKTLSQPVPTTQRRGLRPATRETIAFYIFIMPWLLGFLIFTFGPMIVSAYLSFTNYSVIGSPEWAGLANYRKMWNSDLFWKSLNNTLFMVVFDLPLGLIASLGVALLLNQRLRGVNVFRAIFYLPVL